MTFEQLKKKIRSSNWYRQGAAGKPLYLSYPMRPWFSLTVFDKPATHSVHGRTNRVSHGLTFVTFAHENIYNFIEPESAVRLARYYVSRNKRHPDFITRLNQRWQKTHVAQFTIQRERVESIKLKALDDDVFQKLFADFSKAYHNLWPEVLFLDAFDIASEQILSDAVRREGVTFSDDELHLLTEPGALSWIQQERLELLRLAEQYSGSQAFKSAVKKHATRYHWILNDYDVQTILSPSYFLTEIKNLRKEKKLRTAEQEHLEAVSLVKKRKQALIQKKKLSRDFQNIVHMLVCMARMRDDRKAYNQMAHGTVKMFAQEFARRLDIPLPEIEYLVWWELLDAHQHVRSTRSHARTRMRHPYIFIGDPLRQKNVFKEQQAAQLLQLLTERIASRSDLKGTPAFKGLVRGTVKIILSQAEFKKMKQGDILVAPNTRPEYVPIMKRASAIVTEEGGMTSHAAIVSRELRVPCIVGVQGATVALKTGDEVEVDAERGIVHKLNAKK